MTNDELWVSKVEDIESPDKEVNVMTINILFLTITINKRKITLETVLNDQRVERLFEEAKEQAGKYIRY